LAINKIKFFSAAVVDLFFHVYKENLKRTLRKIKNEKSVVNECLFTLITSRLFLVSYCKSICSSIVLFF